MCGIPSWVLRFFSTNKKVEELREPFIPSALPRVVNVKNLAIARAASEESSTLLPRVVDINLKALERTRSDEDWSTVRSDDSDEFFTAYGIKLVTSFASV